MLATEIIETVQANQKYKLEDFNHSNGWTHTEAIEIIDKLCELGILQYDDDQEHVSVVGYKRQSKKHSITEAIIVTIAGTFIAFGGQLVFFPMFGIVASFSQNIGLTICFSLLSAIRSYIIRRIFNKIGHKK